MEEGAYLTRTLEFAEAADAATYEALSAQGWELVSTHAARRRGAFTNPDVLTHVVAIFRRRTGRDYPTRAGRRLRAGPRAVRCRVMVSGNSLKRRVGGSFLQDAPRYVAFASCRERRQRQHRSWPDRLCVPG